MQVREKRAMVEWKVPSSLIGFSKKIFSYAKWDSEKRIWWHPVQKFKTHNIKVLLVLGRYLFGVLFLVLGFEYRYLHYLLAIALILYLIRSFKKASYRGIFLQIWVDILVMSGFLVGLIKK